MRRTQCILVAFIALFMLLFGSSILAAQENDPAKPVESAEPPSEVTEVQENPDDISEGPRDITPKADGSERPLM